MELIRGTTPTIRFTFSSVDPAEIVDAYMVIKQNDADVVKKELTDATVGATYLEWLLLQTDTLALAAGTPAQVCLDWLLGDGTRGAGNEIAIETVRNPAVNEVI